MLTWKERHTLWGGVWGHKVLATKHKDSSLSPHTHFKERQAKRGLLVVSVLGRQREVNFWERKNKRERGREGGKKWRKDGKGREEDNKKECVNFIRFILVIFKFLSSFYFLQCFCYLMQIHEWSCPTIAERFFRGQTWPKNSFLLPLFIYIQNF